MNKQVEFLVVISLILSILSGAASLLTTLNPNSFFNIYNAIIGTYLALRFFKRASYMQLIFFSVVLISSFFSEKMSSHAFISVAYKMPLASVILLPKSHSSLLLRKVSMILKIFVAISFVMYLFSFVGGVPLGTYFSKDQYSGINQLFLLNYSYNYRNKFCGFCLEPGYFSLLCVALLCVDKFDTKKILNNIVLLSIILSFSLGGYLLSVIGWTAFVAFNNELENKLLKRLFPAITAFIFLLVLSNQFSLVQKMFDDKIIARMELDSDKGIVGNNRQSTAAEIYLLSVLESREIIWGIGSEKYQEDKNSISYYDACSYLVFLVQYGIIYTILLLSSLALFTFGKNDKKRNFLYLFLVFIADFIQHGLPFGSLFILYILYVNTYRSSKSIHMHERLSYLSRTNIKIS